MHKLCLERFFYTMFMQVNKILNRELVNITQDSNVIITAQPQR